MKVLQIIPHYRPAYQYGGPIFSVHNLSKGMVERGVEVTVWTTNLGLKHRKDILLGEEVLIDGVRVYYFPIIGSFHYSLSPALMKYMKDRIRDFDVVHIQGVYQFHSFVGGYYARKYEIPYVLTPRGMLIPELIKMKGRLKKKIYISLVERKNVEKADLVHCTTEIERNELLNLGLNPKKTVVIPNSAELEECNEFSMRESFRKKYDLFGKTIILFFSRLNWKKGIDLLIPAFAKVVSRHPDAHLVFVGPDLEGYRRKIEVWIKENGIEEHVTFTGLLTGSEKLVALKESDIFVLPSYSENFGIAVVEAMLSKLPVIISKEVGIWNVVKENNCGMIVDLTPKSIAEGILHLLKNPEERLKMGERGKETAKREFSIDNIAEKMIQAYNDII